MSIDPFRNIGLRCDLCNGVHVGKPCELKRQPTSGGWDDVMPIRKERAKEMGRPPGVVVGWDSVTGMVQVDAHQDSGCVASVQMDSEAARKLASVLNAMADVAEKK